MKKILLLLAILVLKNNFAQIQSDTTAINLNDSIQIKVVNGYFFGDIQYCYNLSKWYRLGKGPLPYLLNDISELYTIENSSYAFIPSGLLRLNDSTIFIIGWGGTYEYRGAILKSINNGESWDLFKLPNYNSILRPKDQFFVNQNIGITIFDIRPDEKYDYCLGITFDQGETWKEKNIKSNQFKLSKNGVLIHGEIKTVNDYYRFIDGEYSLNNGRDWTKFKIGNFN